MVYFHEDYFCKRVKEERVLNKTQKIISDFHREVKQLLESN